MLVFLKYLFIVISFVCGVYLLIGLIKTKKPIKFFGLSSLYGLTTLFVVWIIGKIIKKTIEINLSTLIISGVLGIPGVIILLFIELLWF